MRRLLPLLLLAACSAPSAAPPAAPPAHDYVLVFLQRGEGGAGFSPEQRQQVQAAHLANIGRLAEAGDIVVAGPFLPGNPDPSQRGLFIFDVPTVAEAEELTRTDPAVKAGVLKLEAHPLSSAADLQALLARDLAARAERRAAGHDEMGMGMRAYVIAIAPDAARAGPLLDGHPRTCLAARFGGDWAGRGLWVLDAADLAAADALVAEFGGRAGPLTLYPWFGSDGFAGLASAGR